MRIIGVDANASSMAYSVIEDDKLIDYGLVKFGGVDNQRIQNAYKCAKELFDDKQPDHVCIEKAVFVQNQSVLITLSYIFGAMLAASPVPVSSVRPMEWQNFIGNKVLTNADKNLIKQATPNKSDNWYKNAYRDYRKNVTRQWVKQTYGVEIESDDICDSIGLGYYGSKNAG